MIRNIQLGITSIAALFVALSIVKSRTPKDPYKHVFDNHRGLCTAEDGYYDAVWYARDAAKQAMIMHRYF